jgi:vacuole morphology and inheritance protein 14
VVSSFERPNRLKAREDSNVRWVELLEKFRTTQERARKQSRGALGVDGDNGDDRPPVPDKEVAVVDQARLPQRIVPRAGTPTGGQPQPQVVQKPIVKSKVGLGLGRFGSGGGKKDKKK